MSDTVTTIFGLIGGLALFLYGMNSMSAALQKAAGDKMKKVLSALTRNRVLGAIAGALVTAVLQSSSATTVMVIGFVSAGLMTLPQGISVIFGANIGTTMTAQLLAFKISDYIYPIIFIGFLINFIPKNEKVKEIGKVIFSFGLLFEGIEIMGDVMKPLASSAFFLNLMGMVGDIPLLGVLLGALMTVVVQSSSATIAVLQNFASQPMDDGVTSVLGLTGAIPILLGDNIGTTITALLASIGQSKDAKRTAIAHSIFNITGSIVFLFLINPLANFVTMISPKGNEVDVISRQIANAHTVFNVTVAIVWLCLLDLMVKIVMKLIPGDDREHVNIAAPKFLDEKVLKQPAVALHLVTEEITNCAEYVTLMFKSLKDEIIGTNLETSKADFDTRSNAVQQLQTQISDYITKLLSNGGLTENQAEQAAGLLYVTNNIERIADRSEDITTSVRKMRENGKSLSEDATKDLSGCMDDISGLFTRAMESVENGDTDEALQVENERNDLRKTERKLNKAHMKRVKNKVCDAELTSDFSNILYNMGRVADNCSMVAEEATDNVDFKEIELLSNDVKEISDTAQEDKKSNQEK